MHTSTQRELATSKGHRHSLPARTRLRYSETVEHSSRATDALTFVPTHLKVNGSNDFVLCESHHTPDLICFGPSQVFLVSLHTVGMISDVTRRLYRMSQLLCYPPPSCELHQFSICFNLYLVRKVCLHPWVFIADQLFSLRLASQPARPTASYTISSTLTFTSSIHLHSRVFRGGVFLALSQRLLNNRQGTNALGLGL